MPVLKDHNIFVVALCAAVLSSCGLQPSGDNTAVQKVPLVPNIDIGFLHSLYNAVGGGTAFIYDDLILGGYVTTNDRSGNFYRVFTLQDATGAVEIRAGVDELHNLFPVGRFVSVTANGLAVGMYNGVLQLGMRPVDGSGYETDYFAHRAMLELYTSRSDLFGSTEPQVFSLPELREWHCGMLVKVKDLFLLVEEEPDGQDDDIIVTEDPHVTWAVPRSEEVAVPETVYHLFRDTHKNEIAVMSSGYANFAGEYVPPGRLALTGILSYGTTPYGTKFILKLRDLNDVEK